MNIHVAEVWRLFVVIIAEYIYVYILENSELRSFTYFECTQSHAGDKETYACTY